MGRIAEGPTWTKTTKRLKNYPPLPGSLETDILIIGGGMAGINILYELINSGKKAVLIESNRIGTGATEYTTAFLTHVIDTSITTLRDIYGQKRAKLVWEAHKMAIKRYQKIITKEKIDCEFTICNYCLYATSKKDIGDLHEQYQLAKQFDFPVTMHLKNDQPFKNYGYLEVQEQAKFHPLKYLHSLAKIAVQKGSQIYEKTEAKKLIPGKIVTVQTSRGEIKAKQVIIATYAPFQEPTTYKIRKAMYQDHLYESRVPKGLFSEGIYADNENPYHYWRVDRQEKFDRLIFGGETHRIEIPMDDQTNYQALKNHFFAIMPKTKIKLIRRWTGPLLEPSDGLASIGYFMDQKNVYVATAFSGNGMTYSGIAAMILKDLLFKKKNIYTSVFAADRDLNLKAHLKKGQDYIETFVGGALRNLT